MYNPPIKNMSGKTIGQWTVLDSLREALRNIGTTKHEGMVFGGDEEGICDARHVCPRCVARAAIDAAKEQLNDRPAATREQRLGSVADGKPSTEQSEAIPRTGDVKEGSIPSGPATVDAAKESK